MVVTALAVVTMSAVLNNKIFRKFFEKFFEKIFEKFSNFSKTFRTFRSFENFSRNRSRRDDSFGPKIVEFRAILAIFRPFEDRNQTE